VNRAVIILITLLVLPLAGCDLFLPRVPEPPVADAGTYRQPDAPGFVVENMVFAIAELNTGNYRRSLAADFRYEASAAARERDPILDQWSMVQEEQYFSTLVASARDRTGHVLRLSDAVESYVDDNTFQYDAAYHLTVNHGRVGAQTDYHGRLLWEMVREEGLWRIRTWIDREEGSQPTWSDLRATFVR
jgi:hypothetical protein